MNYWQRINRHPLSLSAFIVIILIGVTLLLIGENAWADGRKKVYVSFKFDGRRFGLIPEEVRKEISDDLANDLATKAEEQYQFLNWVVGSPPSSEEPSWTVTLKAEVVSSTKADGTEKKDRIGRLLHLGSMFGKSIQFEQVDIYPQGSSIPFRDPVKLKKDVESEFELQLSTLLQTKNVRDFINNIPISENVYADEVNQVVIIDFNFNDLHTDTNTKLRVELVDSSDEKSGTLKLVAQKFDGSGEHTGLVKGYFTEVMIPVIRGFSEKNYWHSDFPEVIGAVKNKKVFMESYSPSVFAGVSNHGASSSID